LASTDGNPPPILDPFAGGGTIPLEAQRLGLKAHASDLNPVAVLINKALVEIPPKFAGQPPVFPGLAGDRLEWEGSTGLAADIRAYGEWMRDEAQERIGGHYPKATLDDGTEATVIAWIWARTVRCPNPACGIEMPLVRSWWLGKKKGKEAWVRPIIAADAEHPSGKRVEFEIGEGASGAPTASTDGTIGRRGARCIACSTAVPLNYIRVEGRARRLGQRMMSIVAAGQRQRVYLAATAGQVGAAEIEQPANAPSGSLGYYPRDIKAPIYGLTEFSDLFTNRQLLALTTFSDLVAQARERAFGDAVAAGVPRGDRLEAGGTDAEAYADAVSTYLGMQLSRLADLGNALCRWEPVAQCPRQLFARQAIPMVWDFAEGNPLGSSSGSWTVLLTGTARAFGGDLFGSATIAAGSIRQGDGAAGPFDGHLISTDPPYYDNIGYSDLSDFFYVWLRRSLRSVHPELLSTMLVPKAEELVANPYRHDGKAGAKNFFEHGFQRVFAHARASALEDFPITVYYAFKQSDAGDDGTASTGWETLLDGMIRSGWAITATWPVRSEASNRMLSHGKNALASSIVLALRPRSEGAPTTDRRGLIAALHDELPDALRKLQQGTIAPVDLPQAAIGPGMAVFSRYAKVIENDGTTMTVRSALARINEILDQVLTSRRATSTPRLASRSPGIGSTATGPGSSEWPTTSPAPATRRSRRWSATAPSRAPRARSPCSRRPPCRRTTTCSPTTASAPGRCSTT
jgi:putative DNA methylase